MAKDYTIENVYEPGYKSFTPSDDSPYIGKQGFISTHQLGLTTDPRTANQLAALSTALNQGVSVMEIGNISPATFDQIPKQHFTEMRRKAKLVEAELTLHAPIQGTDPSGFAGEGGYNELNREMVEKHLKDVVEKAIELDDKGNMPITIHGSNAAGSTFKYVTDENGVRKKVADMLVAVDRETGQLRPIKEDTKYYPNFGVDKQSYTPKKQLEIANRTLWEDQIEKIEFQKVNIDNILSKIPKEAQMMALRASEDQEYFKQLGPNEKNLVLKTYSAKNYLDDVHRSLNGAFSKAYELGTEDQRKELEKMSKEFAKELYGVESDKVKNGNLNERDKMIMNQTYHDFQNQANAMQIFAENLKKINPQLLQDIESFSIEKASKTFANVAMHGYEKRGEKAPALSIENLYQEMGFSQGDDLKNLVVASREKLKDQLINEKRMSKSKAEEVAAKLIGVTFDVGHLNISRKYGYNEKDLVEEAKKVKPYINKVHLTDNFGASDSHLPPGMGNVPFQALLEAIGEEGAKAIKINEVGGWFEHFKTSPFPQILEAFGSPIYSAGTGPYWSQAGGFQQSYMEGYGQILPPTNYQMFGAGFSQLPQSLGGQQGQQGGGRMGSGGF